jgi:hypothetical protein
VYKDPLVGSTSRDPYWEDSAVSLLECFMEYAQNDLYTRHGRYYADTMIGVLELLDEYMFIPVDERNGDYAKTPQGRITERLPKITSNTAVIGAWKSNCTTTVLQRLSQLISTYGESGAITICNNCDRMVYPGSNDLKSAVEIAQRVDLPTTDVLNMPIGREIFFQRGQKPILTNCYNVFTDSAYAEMLKVSAEAEREETE